MKPWTVIRPLVYRPRGYRTWELLEPYEVVDHLGRIWILPAGFRLDFFSVPRLFWWWRPPIDGTDGDGAAALHDFMARSWRILQIDRRDVPSTFRHAVTGLGSSRTRATIKWLATWPHIAFLSDGNGLSGDERYDHPVLDEPTGAVLSLPEWCRLHYPHGPRKYAA